jgi:hypothetical protein
MIDESMDKDSEATAQLSNSGRNLRGNVVFIMIGGVLVNFSWL